MNRLKTSDDLMKRIRWVEEQTENRQAKRVRDEKVAKNFQKVNPFIKKEIEKGKDPLGAIDEVLNNHSIMLTYQDLKNPDIKRRVRNLFLAKYCSKEKEGR